MDIIIHIGLHKTGTTFLQKYFYSKLEDVQYINSTDPIHKSIDGLNDKTGKLLMSSEGFSGNPFKENWLQQFYTNLRFIKNIFPHCQIILGLRDHKKLAISLYSQYIHQGGTLSINDFYNGKGKLSPIDFSFKKRIEFLFNLFGREKILLIWQGSLLKRNKETINILAEFIKSNLYHNSYIPTDKRPNKGVGKINGELLRRFNQLDEIFYKYKLPGLRNSLLRKLRLDSRTVCQVYLRKINKAKFDLPFDFSHKLDAIIQEDKLFLKSI